MNVSKPAKKSTRLHQLLAVEKGVRNASQSVIDRTHHALQQGALFNGFARNWEPEQDDGPVFPNDRTIVQEQVPDLVKQFTDAMGDRLDVWFKRDATNQVAKADVVVDGVTLVKDAPVTFLLALEKEFVHIKTFISKAPTLDSAKDWKPDGQSGLYKTKEAVKTQKTQKVEEAATVIQPTEHQPGQYHVFKKDVILGYWSQIFESGAIPATTKRLWTEKADKVLRAIREAREAANATTVVEIEKNVGEDLFGFVFAPVKDDD